MPAGHTAALVAVGGFGRGELHPHSDVDLLVLLKSDATRKSLRPAIESLVTLLWDAGFYLGHSVRTVKECRQESAADVTTATSLMEARLLSGDRKLFTRMRDATGPKKVWSGTDFFRAKYDEQVQRHQQFHETAFNLEPNIKEGPGGLRDIQMIGWVAKRQFGAQTLHGLVEHGFLTESEHRHLIQGQRFLWRVRFALHLLSGRAEDRLLFDHQRRIAERFGFENPQDSNRAVEQFMQGYYRNVMELERLNDCLLHLFRQEIMPSSKATPVPLGDHFHVRGTWLHANDEQLFLRDPAALMEVFLLLANHPEIDGLGASTIRLIRDHLYLVDDVFRDDPGVLATFLELLKQESGVYTQLQRMNRYGLLAAYLPAFGQIVGRMQFDLFHVYSVDQHILFVIRNLRRFAYGKYQDQFPHAANVFLRIDRPHVLYLAALFHDIAKGRGGDHSVLGAEEAEQFCARLDLDQNDRDLVAWLVSQHLVMSQTAQRRDISDPATIRYFAAIANDRRKLDHLYLLTVADIAATSPKLWNSWKSSLMWELYSATVKVLDTGHEAPEVRRSRLDDSHQVARESLLSRGFEEGTIEHLWSQLPEYALLRFSQQQLVWALSRIMSSAAPRIVVAIREAPGPGVSEVLVSAPNFDGLFATVTALFDEMGLNVLSARVTTTADNRSFDLFELTDRHGKPLHDPDTSELIQRLSEPLRDARVVAPVQRKMPRRLRPFVSNPRIRFGQAREGEVSTMEVRCTDRPGLLSQLAAAMVSCGIRVHDARIATFGDHAEDTFMITDQEDRPLDEAGETRLLRAVTDRLSKDN